MASVRFGAPKKSSKGSASVTKGTGEHSLLASQIMTKRQSDVDYRSRIIEGR